MMKLAAKIGTLMICLFVATTFALPQDQAKNSKEQNTSHLKIDFLLTEYNGQQTISNTAYHLGMEAGPDQREGKIRMGVKVPVAQGNNDFQYMLIGTDIDCAVKTLGDGSYDLHLIISRSSIYAETSNGSQAQAETPHPIGTHPVIQQFSTDFPLNMHDGETAEGTSATDPFSGHVLKINVTLHVVK